MAVDQEIKFGIAIPQIFPSGVVEPPAIARCLAKAESLGYYGAWVMAGWSLEQLPRPPSKKK